jgi:ABC-type branched-subunit amino acid transport system substrate-binding protein
LLVVGLIVGAGITYALSSSSMASTVTSTSVSTTTVGAGATATETVTSTVTGTGSGGLTGTVNIGDLTDLSGELQAIGSQQKIAVGLAITDINNYLTAIGDTNVKFATITEDTGLNPATALTDLQTLSADGVQVVVGPLTSG